VASLITEPAAASLLVLDETGGATLSEIARATGRQVSTIQRALEGLADSGVVAREFPRGRFVISGEAPRKALRELAEWRLGAATSRRISSEARRDFGWSEPPSSIRNDVIREAWPAAIRTIVNSFHPAQVILFGSQAHGHAGIDSDVDLLVILDEDLEKRGTRVGIRRALRSMPFAKDVLVASREELQHPPLGSAIAEALRDGIVVYER
jgi:predicted nucleotidyltransferase